MSADLAQCIISLPLSKTGRHIVSFSLAFLLTFSAGAFYSFDWALFLGTAEHQGFLFLLPVIEEVDALSTARAKLHL